MAGPGSDGPSGVRREHVFTAEPDESYEWMRAAYTDHHPTIYGDRQHFEFSMRSTAVGPLHLTEMRHSLGFVAPSAPADKLIVMALSEGERMRIACEGDDAVAPVMLAPTWAPFTAQWDSMALETMNLDLGDVADHAEQTCGIPADDLAFRGSRPRSPKLARHWRATVAHVRDDVLADPELTAEPIIVDNAFRCLATALLAAFPNTALDPDTPSVVGDVSPASLREVTDYLDTHAAEPVGPAEVAEVAGAPYHHVADGLQRRRGVHPAQLLWAARLRGTFRDLSEADPTAGDTVAGVAARWGFANPQTFAEAYTMTTGGETPDDTLRR